MDKEVEEETQRAALRKQIEDAHKDSARLRATLTALVGILVVTGLVAGVFGVMFFSKPSPSPPKCGPAVVIGDNTVATTAPGTEPNEPHTELYPLTVSIEGHSRCFTIKWDGKIDREAECGYTIDYKELRKAICVR
jgi:hypothetical protein